MKKAETRFPSLAADAQLADVQVRLTLAMGLVPLGIALLLMAAGAPRWPSAGLWVGAGASLGGMGVLAWLWRRSGGRAMRGFSTLHFLVRYLFLALCPVLMWTVYGEVILDLAGPFPPIWVGMLLVLHPAGRLLQERVGGDPANRPRAEMARILCGLGQGLLATLAVIGLLSGAAIDAHRDYPTDPAPALLLLWLVALLAAVGAAALAAAHWSRLLGRKRAPQPLDDPPGAPPPAGPPRFGSDQF